MEELLIFAALVSFVAFLIPGRHSFLAGIAGWVFMVLFLFAEIPYYLSINNFLYPTLAVVSVPLVWVTAKRLREGDQHVIYLTRAAAAASLVYIPFAYTPLGDWLIGIVVGQIAWCLTAMGVDYSMFDWNMFWRNGFRVEIILGCTGIQSMAIMIGVAAAVPTTLRQKLAAILLIVPTIYLLNIFRNVFVIVAYTDQWFPYLTGIAGNGEFGYESFFWSHNVLCELGALVALVAIAYLLFQIIPSLGRTADALIGIYRDEITRAIPRGK
ncbi:archaeosortase A [Methanofollis fontis]|uniref:Archaeosortase A n=1 Tax=Methanofollis fontis TaxID=2052832 RepID=A0A483CXA2_9EURY|nr:archaeosortase A [Methanofollis fontis]TAJ44489.1 archaeosortase A [Methanofollis fontis]